MKCNSIIIRYGEIALKGKNRIQFELMLKRDIEDHLRLHHLSFQEILLQKGRLYIRGIEASADLEKILGIHSYSPALEIEHDYDTLLSSISQFIPMVKGRRSFRVSCQRVDKRFSPDSLQIERQVGTEIHEATHTPVNLEKPEFNVQIEIGTHHIYLFHERISAWSGFPYGCAGRLVSLISGGIDSPVATFMLMKRGVEPILLHFLINPNDSAETEKVVQLKKKLEEYTAGREIKLYFIPRDEVFRGKFSEIFQSRHHAYVCIICKFLMHRKAAEIIKAENAFGVITGDNLSQVASQTLPNLLSQRFLQPYPVYSPLIGMEKTEIIALAKRIGTYPLSIAKEKGCTPPENPKTQVKPERLEAILKEIGLWDQAPRVSSPDPASQR